MNFNAPCILAIVAVGLAVIGLIKPAWPVTAVAVLLLGVAVVVLAGK